MASSAVDDELDKFPLEARFCVEDVATLVLVLLLLKSQNLGNNESGARIVVAKDLRIFIFIHLAVHGHLLDGVHFIFTHGIIGAVSIHDHSSYCWALEGLVASSFARKALDVTCFVGVIRRSC